MPGKIAIYLSKIPVHYFHGNYFYRIESYWKVWNCIDRELNTIREIPLQILCLTSIKINWLHFFTNFEFCDIPLEILYYLYNDSAKSLMLENDVCRSCRLECAFIVLEHQFRTSRKALRLSLSPSALIRSSWPYKLSLRDSKDQRENAAGYQCGEKDEKTYRTISATYTLTKNTAIYYSSGYPRWNPVASHFTDLSLRFSRASGSFSFPPLLKALSIYEKC